MKYLIFSLLTMTALAFQAPQAHAFPLTSRHWTPKEPLSIFYTPGFNFDGIVALSNCSGSLVRFKTSQDSDRAMVLTNGHCVQNSPFGGGFLQPGEVLLNESASFNMQLLSKSGGGVLALESNKILYATMTDTDVGLLELTTTYAAISQATGVKALTLADSLPAMGLSIQIPSGYWKRTYSCQTEAIIPELHEADWTFKRSILFSTPGCETIGGTSGSPLVSSASGEVIGINNTTNEDGEQCTLNNPCEVDSQGHQTVRQGRAYGQQTYQFYGCLANNRIDLSLPTCTLPKPH